MIRHIATDNNSMKLEVMELAPLSSVVPVACDAVDASVAPETVDPDASDTGVVDAAVDVSGVSARKSLAIIAVTAKATKTNKIANLMMRYLLKF